MVRSILAGGLIANGLLFAAGVWRSVMAGKPAFHTLGDIMGGQGGMADIWLWPLTILLLCAVLVLANRPGAPKSRKSPDEEHNATD
ncbi:MAG: hypothetical protein COA47_00145 [Robiginitomaculum sp.]|nr:MAG: hypothetical protein COA47_00145 [Robiginitomaculum sp.]